MFCKICNSALSLICTCMRVYVLGHDVKWITKSQKCFTNIEIERACLYNLWGLRFSIFYYIHKIRECLFLKPVVHNSSVLQVQKSILKIIIWHIFPLPFPIPRKGSKGHFRKPPSLFLPSIYFFVVVVVRLVA